MNDVLIVILSILAIPSWFLVGAACLSFADPDEILLAWYLQCPSQTVSFLVLLMWPALLVAWLVRR